MGFRREVNELFEDCSTEDLYLLLGDIETILWKRLRTFNEAPSHPRLFLAALLVAFKNATQSHSSGFSLRHVFNETSKWSDFVRSVSELDAWYEKQLQRTASEADRQQFYAFAAELILHKVQQLDHDPILQHCFYWINKVPAIISANFPGYLESNVLKVVVDRRACQFSTVHS